MVRVRPRDRALRWARQAGKAGARAAGVEYDSIVVVGHADRIGTENYNLRLSTRRANSVKDYLVKQGLPADKIQAEGRGEFEPSTQPGVCQDVRKPQVDRLPAARPQGRGDGNRSEAAVMSAVSRGASPMG